MESLPPSDSLLTKVFLGQFVSSLMQGDDHLPQSAV